MMTPMYAIMTSDGQYRCQQGNETWTQLDCVGWAIVDDDRRYLQSRKQDGDLVVKVVRGYCLAGTEHEAAKRRGAQ